MNLDSVSTEELSERYGALLLIMSDIKTIMDESIKAFKRAESEAKVVQEELVRRGFKIKDYNEQEQNEQES